MSVDILIEGWWLKREAVKDVAEKFGLKSVPIIGKGTLEEAVKMAQAGFNSQ